MSTAEAPEFLSVAETAQFLAEAMTGNQALELGLAGSQRDVAIWTQSPEGQNQLQRERRELLGRLRRRV